MALTHHWNLQETSGTTVVDSVGGNNGTLDGSVTVGDTGPGGSVSRSVRFAGSNAPIVLDSQITLADSADWAIAFWAQQDNDDKRGMVLGRRTNTTDFLRLSSPGDGMQDSEQHKHCLSVCYFQCDPTCSQPLLSGPRLHR